MTPTPNPNPGRRPAPVSAAAVGGTDDAREVRAIAVPSGGIAAGGVGWATAGGRVGEVVADAG
jgi:hypothetical protein